MPEVWLPYYEHSVYYNEIPPLEYPHIVKDRLDLTFHILKFQRTVTFMKVLL